MAPVSLDTILARQKKYFRLEYIELVLTSDAQPELSRCVRDSFPVSLSKPRSSECL